MTRILSMLLSLLLLASGLFVSSRAHSQATERTFGTWTVFEDLDYDGLTPPKRTGIADTATTMALNGRAATLGFTCSTYTVSFSLDVDAPFGTALQDEPNYHLVYQPIYIKVDGESSLHKQLAMNAYKKFFYFPAEPLASGANLTICPVNDDKSPACLNFSLRGIAAALKAICPKR